MTHQAISWREIAIYNSRAILAVKEGVQREGRPDLTALIQLPLPWEPTLAFGTLRIKGANWAPLSNGLPEAPVFDLLVHPTKGLLPTATHGRGMYELPL